MKHLIIFSMVALLASTFIGCAQKEPTPTYSFPAHSAKSQFQRGR